MLIYAYVFALVLGSVLLGASFLLGGKDLDHDHDVGHDIEAHVDHDLDGHAEAGHEAHGDLGGFFGVLASMRFWTFFAAFFGLTGIVLDGLDLAIPSVSLGLAIGVGFLTGWTAVTLIKRLSANDTGVAATVDDYVGKSGEMLIAAGPNRLGKIRIELKGTTVDVLAESDEHVIPRGEQALIVEMRGPKAAVVKLDAARAEAHE
jgi:membrane protein implicated in regulation of membrane protease activity